MGKGAEHMTLPPPLLGEMPGKPAPPVTMPCMGMSFSSRPPQFCNTRHFMSPPLHATLGRCCPPPCFCLHLPLSTHVPGDCFCLHCSLCGGFHSCCCYSPPPPTCLHPDPGTCSYTVNGAGSCWSLRCLLWGNWLYGRAMEGNCYIGGLALNGGVLGSAVWGERRGIPKGFSWCMVGRWGGAVSCIW